MKRRLLAFLSLVVLGSDAWAARTISLFPIHMDTVAGGAMGTVTAGMYSAVSATACVTADIIYPPAAGAGGVVTAYHSYKINLRNISDLEQTVRITIEKGSQVSSAVSQPGSGIPNGPKRSVTVGADSTYAVKLAKSSALTGDSLTVDLFIGCSKSTCWIAHPGGLAAGSVDPLVATQACPVSAQAICMTANSDVHLRLSVDEDRGAVVGSISTAAHRQCGYKDHYIEPPPFVQINGGRPF